MPLNAFDGALMDAGIGDLNLVRLSSILPPYCREVEAQRLPYGALVPTAYASINSSTPGEIISAGVAIAIPEDPQYPGLIMEYSGKGTAKQIHDIVRKMAEDGLCRRERKIKEIRSTVVEHKVIKHGSAMAAVVLWDED
jgi:arginine decarboxylase